MRKLSLALLIALVSFTSFSYADYGVKVNGTSHNDATNIDFKAQPGSDVLTQKGLTRSIPVLGSTMFATGVANGGATSIASTTNAVPVGYAYVRMAITANSDPAFTAKTLANGVPGQFLTIEVVALSNNAATGGNATITPALSTGFSKVKLSAVNDTITFHFVDTTVGWTIVNWSPGGSSSITITGSSS